VEKRRTRTKPTATPEIAFAQVLRDLRNRKGLSQENLGFDSGYHRTYISMLERGLMNPSLKTILQLASALSTTGADIVARVEARLSPKQTSV
jgi:transcriptional regulator with XRE-family HTH domain